MTYQQQPMHPMASMGFGAVHPAIRSSRSHERIEEHSPSNSLPHQRSDNISTVFGDMSDRDGATSMSLIEASAAIFHLLAEAEAAEDGYLMASVERW